MDRTRHNFILPWDAPLDEVGCSYTFLPGAPATGPDRWGPGDPGWPDEVEVDPRSVQVRVGPAWHDAPWLADWIAEQHYEDLCLNARHERACRRAAA